MDQSTTSPDSIICIVEASPNFMKIVPMMAALKKFEPSINVSLVHTAQHCDETMNEQYFQALGIPNPDINLEISSGTHKKPIY